MKVLLSIAVVLCFFILNFDTGSALTCYSCSTVVGNKHDCEVKVNNKTVPTTYCNSGYTACMSLAINNTLTRACAVTNVCQLYRNTTGFKSCVTCATDFCNGSTTVATSLGASLGLVVVLLTAAKMAIY